MLAIVALFYFSWLGLAVALFGLFVVAPIGVNVGYHRLLSHRAFQAPSWLMHTLVTIGAVVGAGPPLIWAAQHRLHHRYSETDLDPHNSKKGFWYAHILHLFYSNEFETKEENWSKYIPDLMQDRYLRFLNKYWILIALAVVIAMYFVGGISLVLWGSFVRVVISWHTMWFVNSASHMWGYRNHDTKDNTRNCWWVGILASGEGWHNNHHANPSAAAHGEKWWEIDFSYFLIFTMEKMGLISDVKRQTAAKKVLS